MPSTNPTLGEQVAALNANQEHVMSDLKAVRRTAEEHAQDDTVRFKEITEVCNRIEMTLSTHVAGVKVWWLVAAAVGTAVMSVAGTIVANLVSK